MVLDGTDHTHARGGSGDGFTLVKEDHKKCVWIFELSVLIKETIRMCVRSVSSFVLRSFVRSSHFT